MIQHFHGHNPVTILRNTVENDRILVEKEDGTRIEVPPSTVTLGPRGLGGRPRKDRTTRDDDADDTNAHR